MVPFQSVSAGDEIVQSLSPIESDTSTEGFRARYDSTRDPTSLAVIAVVAAADNEDPIELPPLECSIDTGALDNLFEGPVTIGEGYTRVTFCYGGFEVTVFDDGLIEATPIE